MSQRVLMTVDAIGGVWTFALELARGLTADGGEVLLAVIGPAPDAAQRAEAAAIAGLSLAETGLGLEWQDRAGPLQPQACRELLTLERTFRPDLVHCNGFREAAAGFAAPVVLTAHSCVATWWQACRGEPLPPDWSDYARGVRAGLAAASAVVAPTESYRCALARAWGTALPVRVVRNGLDLAAPPIPARRRPIVLAAGRLWDDAKNVAALAGIAPELPWPVLLAGDPPAAGLAGVRHLGRLSRAELRRLMAEAAIFVAPARYEPFGLAILEAAAAGCALVLGRVPSLVELWGDAARLVPPDDPSALRDTLLDLIGDENALLRLQRAASTRAAALGRAPMMEGYRGVYASVLAEQPRTKVQAA